LIFNARCERLDVLAKSSRSSNRLHLFTLFFIRGSVLPSVDLPHSQHPFVRRGVGSIRRSGHSVAVETKPAHIAPDLQAIIDAWPTLPEAIRTGILAMIRAAAEDRFGHSSR
jgi:hypothetical protein